MNCKFEVRSENEDERVDLGQQYVRNTHNKEMFRNNNYQGFKEV